VVFIDARQMARDGGIISEPTVRTQILTALTALIAHTVCSRQPDL
jgi:hypothetical protein